MLPKYLKGVFGWTTMLSIATQMDFGVAGWVGPDSLASHIFLSYNYVEKQKESNLVRGSMRSHQGEETRENCYQNTQN